MDINEKLSLMKNTYLNTVANLQESARRQGFNDGFDIATRTFIELGSVVSFEIVEKLTELKESYQLKWLKNPRPLTHEEQLGRQGFLEGIEKVFITIKEIVIENDKAKVGV